MIRILHVLGIMNRGGAETMIMNIYRKIDRSKIQFDFVVHREEKGAFDSEIRKLGGRIFRAPQFKGGNLFQYAGWWMYFLNKHKEFCIIHSHIRSTAFIFIPIAKRNKIISIIHSHSSSEGKGVKADIKRCFEYPLRWQGDFFIGCSEQAGKWLFGNRVVHSDRYKTIPNAVDQDKYNLDYHIREKYRNEFGSSDEILFIHIGRMEGVKNHFFLIDIFKDLLKQIDKSKLLLVGDGSLKNNLIKYVKDLGISEKVVFLGIRDDIPNLLMLTDCFLFPSKWEGIPVSVIEAQAAGLPCFISDKINQEVKVTETVTFLPIDRGTKIWVDKIIKSDLSRKDTSMDMKKSGYDVNKSANEIQQLYFELLRKYV